MSLVPLLVTARAAERDRAALRLREALAEGAFQEAALARAQAAVDAAGGAVAATSARLLEKTVRTVDAHLALEADLAAAHRALAARRRDLGAAERASAAAGAAIEDARRALAAAHEAYEVAARHEASRAEEAQRRRERREADEADDLHSPRARR